MRRDAEKCINQKFFRIICNLWCINFKLLFSCIIKWQAYFVELLLKRFKRSTIIELLLKRFQRSREALQSFRASGSVKKLELPSPNPGHEFIQLFHHTSQFNDQISENYVLVLHFAQKVACMQKIRSSAQKLAILHFG